MGRASGRWPRRWRRSWAGSGGWRTRGLPGEHSFFLGIASYQMWQPWKRNCAAGASICFPFERDCEPTSKPSL
jgi:hypothetical protein